MHENDTLASVPLITTRNDGSLELSKEGRDVLLSMESKALKIVAVCGKYRSGKSTLMTQLVNSSNTSTFKIGHTVNACSKGIFFVKIPETNILLLDTEGLNSPDSDATHDTRIFALSLLLSSQLFYNVTTTIDESTLSNLSVVIDFAKNNDFPYC